MTIQTTVGEFCPFEYGKGLSEKKRLFGNIPVYGSNGIVGMHNESFVKTHGIIIGRKGTVGALHLSDRPFWPIDTSFYVVKEDYYEIIKNAQEAGVGVAEGMLCMLRCEAVVTQEFVGFCCTVSNAVVVMHVEWYRKASGRMVGIST